MKSIKTYWARIFIGRRKQYTGYIFMEDAVRTLVRDFVQDVHTCVTLTKTEFAYVGGDEPGFIIEFVNYPRFEESDSDIRDKAFTLARKLMYALGQNRVSVMTPAKTYMFENEKLGR